jgi:hypothetical protein
VEGLDGNAIDDMIEIANSIAHNYEHGLRERRMRRVVRSVDTGCIVAIKINFGFYLNNSSHLH